MPRVTPATSPSSRSFASVNGLRIRWLASAISWWRSVMPAMMPLRCGSVLDPPRTLGPMDLHVVGPAATPEERAAIDAALDPEIGPPRSGWDGGARDTAADGHVAHGGHDARARRDLLLPALEAAAARIGWVSRGALNHVSKRLAVPPAEAYGVASFYALLPTTPRPPIVAHVCDDIACRLARRGADLR